MEFFEHTLVPVTIQLVIAIITGWWRAGALLMSGHFIGREIAQAEYRWIELFGEGFSANMPWWGALDPRAWERPDKIAGWLGLLVATVTVALVEERHRDWNQ